MSIKRILTLVFYAIVLIISIVGFVKIFTADAIGKSIEEMVSDPDIMMGTAILITLSVILISIVILSAFIASPAIAIVANPKGFVKSLIGAGALLVVFGIGYAMAGNEVTRGFEAMGIDSAAKSKLIGGVIYTVFILIVVGVLAYIYSSISSLLKQL